MAEPRVVMMDAARRRAVEHLHRRIGGARGEHPVVAGAETLGAGGREADRDAVLQQQRRAAGRHVDDAGRAGARDPEQTGRAARQSVRQHRAASGPSGARAGCARAGSRLSGNAPGSISAGSAGANVMRRVASLTVMRRISPAPLRELAHVVDDLDPVAAVEAQHVVAAQRLAARARWPTPCSRRGCRRWRSRATT